MTEEISRSKKEKISFAKESIAKLRDNNTNMSSKQIIEIQMGQGHFGNAGRYKSIGELSKKFAFVFDN